MPKKGSAPKRSRSRRRDASRLQRWLLRYGWLLPVGAIVIGGTILGLTYAFARIPLPRDIELASSAEVYDAKGRLIGTYSDEVRRFLIDTDELPEYIGEAVIAAEDRAYYDHSGVSVRGIIRAAWANVTGGAIQQGGSTITQQYVKNAVLQDPGRTITRKVKEAVLAIKLERRFSKDEILGFYLNTIYLGRGAYGFEAAARTYFNTSAKKLTLGQAAYLAGIIPAPESYQPDENPGGAEQRRDRVLDFMEREGFITENAAAEAKKHEIKIARGAIGSVQKRQRAAYFMEWLRRDYLYPEYREELFTSGFKIYTTLNLDMQDAAEAAVGSILPNKDDPQAAVVSMTPRGEVRALVGGRDFTNVRKARGFDYATDFPGRHSGSAFKPFTLLAAIEENISPRSTFPGNSPQLIDDPVCNNEDGTKWEVDNFGGSQFGSIDLVQATTSSVNTVYAQLAAEVGPAKIAEVVADLGFDRKDTNGKRDIPAVCSLSLGTLDVTPLEMARAYAGFAGRGNLPEVMPVRFIENFRGDCVKVYRADRGAEDCADSERAAPDEVVAENSVDVLNQTLTNVVSGGTAQAANIGRPVAGKTGTTQNHANAWFAGHIPQLATVVWLGYPLETRKAPCIGTEAAGECKNGMKDVDFIPLMEYCADTEMCRPVAGDLGYPIAVTGGSFPARIWAAFMSEATAGMDVVEFPVPVDQPDEVINARPSPTAGSPEPKKTKEPKPEPTEEEPEPEPTEEEPEPAPTEDQSPNPIPTQSDRREDDH